MSIKKNIDYGRFHGLIAERIMRDWGLDSSGRAVLEDLAHQGATPKEVSAYLLRILPTWEGLANQVEVVMRYLSNGGGE